MPYPISPEVGVDPLRQRLTHNAHASETPGVVRTHGFAGHFHRTPSPPWRLSSCSPPLLFLWTSRRNKLTPPVTTPLCCSSAHGVARKVHAEDTSRPLAPLASFLRVIRRVSLASLSFVCVSLALLASFSGVWCVSLASFSGVWCVSLASFPSVWCVSLAPLARGHARDAEDAQLKTRRNAV